MNDNVQWEQWGGLNGQNTVNPENVAAVNDLDKPKKKTWVKVLVGVLIVVFIVVISAVVLKFTVFKDSGTVTGTIEQITYVKDENGRVKFVDGRFSDVKVEEGLSAFWALESLKDVLGFEVSSKEFIETHISKNEGLAHYRFQQYYNGVEVYGNNLVLTTDADGNVLSTSGYYTPGINVNTNAEKSEEDVKSIITQRLGGVAEIVSLEKKIMIINNSPLLVYHVMGGSENNGIREYVIDANNGEVLFDLDAANYVNEDVVKELVGIDGVVSPVQLYNTHGNSYELRDFERNIIIIDTSSMDESQTDNPIYYLFGKSHDPMVGAISGNSFIYDKEKESDNDELSRIGVSALRTFEEIYDYYLRLGRKSYDDQGGKINVNIDLRDREEDPDGYWANVAWTTNRFSNQIYIGRTKDKKSYAACKDVLMHEFTHGVDQYTAQLSGIPLKGSKVANETGALKEAYADIMGSLFEGNNWFIAEDSGGIIRNLEEPNANEGPSEKGGKYYYPDYGVEEFGSIEAFFKDRKEKGGRYQKCTTVAGCDRGFIHNNATVVGHAAYLMHKNGAFKDNFEMARVWYNSLSELTPSANFEDCALAVIKTAKNLGLSSDSINIIKWAFYDTKILDKPNAKIEGVVRTDQGGIQKAAIELVDKSDSENRIILSTDSNGRFSGEVRVGDYEINVYREGFDSYSNVVSIMGDTVLDIVLHYERNEGMNGGSLPDKCKGQKCYLIRIYEADTASDQYTSYYAVDGEAIGGDELDRIVNELKSSEAVQGLLGYLGDGSVYRKGNKIYLDMFGLSVPISYYYRGTNAEFDWDTPITEDIDLEVRVGDFSFDLDYDAWGL